MDDQNWKSPVYQSAQQILRNPHAVYASGQRDIWVQRPQLNPGVRVRLRFETFKIF